MIVDATDLILGRMAAVVAKKALLGENVDVINSEKAVMTGTPLKTLESFETARKRGVPLKGPYFPKTADRIVKRTIRGMLPYKKPKGREALARIKCYVGIPDEFKDKDVSALSKTVHVNKTHAKYITVKEISKRLGAKVE